MVVYAFALLTNSPWPSGVYLKGKCTQKNVNMTKGYGMLWRNLGQDSGKCEMAAMVYVMGFLKPI
ncbi:hypothetical protein DESC_40131 [Desulfosarcina cetonica]|nr:hypothetical protein DESC_40131 [Desulfosarcina cetonica]